MTKTRVEIPSVDPQGAAAAAIQEYDKDGDGRLNESELAASPAIANARAHYDKDGDKSISQEEIAQHFEQMFSAGVGLTQVPCTVTRGGRPLSGATVKFVPEAFLGESVQPASGTTDASGATSPSVAPEHLPENLQSAKLMQVGVYRVEIEHPSIAAGSSKPLGFEVDPSRRDGTTARFNL
jgi:hypothetical protein